jgi:hypothetical protein
MILSSFPLLLTMGVVVSVAVSVLLFLPALIELRKPRDAGPRLIADSDSFAFSKSFNAISPNFESETAPLQKSQNELSDLLDANDDEFT